MSKYSFHVTKFAKKKLECFLIVLNPHTGSKFKFTAHIYPSGYIRIYPPANWFKKYYVLRAYAHGGRELFNLWELESNFGYRLLHNRLSVAALSLDLSVRAKVSNGAASFAIHSVYFTPNVVKDKIRSWDYTFNATSLKRKFNPFDDAITSLTYECGMSSTVKCHIDNMTHKEAIS